MMILVLVVGSVSWLQGDVRYEMLLKVDGCMKGTEQAGTDCPGEDYST